MLIIKTFIEEHKKLQHILNEFGGRKQEIENSSTFGVEPNSNKLGHGVKCKLKQNTVILKSDQPIFNRNKTVNIFNA